MSNKGDGYERKLVNRLEEDGYPAIRMPGSGAGSDKDLPDVLIKSGDTYIAGEAKFTSQDHTYVENYELAALIRFAEKWDQQAALLARFSYDTNWYVILAESDMYKESLTKSGNLSIRRNMRDEYRKLSEYLEKLDQ